MFLSRKRLIAALIILFIFSVSLSALQKSIYVSWQDECIIFGPQSDAALDTTSGIDTMLSYWQAQGVNDLILWRSSAEITEDSDIWEINWEGSVWGCYLSKKITDVFDVTSYTNFKAAQMGLTLCGGLEVFSVGIPPEALSWWPVSQDFFNVHPECIVLDRQGNKGWGVPEYGVPLTRQHLVDRFLQLINKYNLSAIFVDQRSESYLGLPPPEHGDQFGFNPEVVSDFEDMYDINILTDPRFDYTSAEYDIHDPMVENWRQLRGSYFTQFLRDLRAATPGIVIATNIRGGDYYGWPLGNMAIQWRTWVDEDLIDALIVNWNMGPPYSSNDDTFLVNVYTDNQGVLPVSTFRNYIDNHNPSVDLYSGWDDPSADGYILASQNIDVDHMRQQLMQDRTENLANDGYLCFIRQNFDDFPVDERGIHYHGLYMYGDMRYNSKENFSEGGWGSFSNLNDDTPTVQDVIRHGNSGSAVMLSGNWTSGNITLFGRRRDQGRLPDQEFAELSDGWIKFSYWLYLENDKSGIDVYMGDYNQPDARLMTLRIDPENDGIIKCQANSGWYSTGLKIEPGRWRKFSIYCNLDERSCWYCIGDESVTILAADLPLPSTPLSVDTVYFKPTGIDSVNNEILGMKVFVDDVEVLWGNSFADFNNYLEGDINTDHYVDFQDFHLMISQWLLCTDPQRPECDVY